MREIETPRPGNEVANRDRGSQPDYGSDTTGVCVLGLVVGA
jgi:hypothetical protein